MSAAVNSKENVKTTKPSPAAGASPDIELPILVLKFEKEEPKKVGVKFEVEAIFTNPLNDTLTECVYHVKGPGLNRPLTITHWDVFPKSEVSKNFIFRPCDPGEYKVTVDFTSEQLAHVKGVLPVEVVE